MSDGKETTEPRVFIVVERLVRGQMIQNRKEISLDLLLTARFSGDMLLNELSAALREVERYR